MTAATVASAGVSKNEQLAGTTIAGRTFRMPPMGDGMSGKGGGIVGNADHQSSAIFQNIINSIGDGDPDGIGAEVVIIDAKRADSQQRPGFLKGRQVRFLLSSAIPPIIPYSTARHPRAEGSGMKRLAGEEDVRLYLFPSGNFPELPGFEAQIHVDVVMSQSIWYVTKEKCGLANFGSTG